MKAKNGSVVGTVKHFARFDTTKSRVWIVRAFLPMLQTPVLCVCQAMRLIETLERLHDMERFCLSSNMKAGKTIYINSTTHPT